MKTKLSKETNLIIKVKLGFDRKTGKETEAVASVDPVVAVRILEHMFNSEITYYATQKLLEYWNITYKKITKE